MLAFTPASSSAKNMIYDNNGNLSSVTNSCGMTTYTRDVRNRLVGISGYKSDCTTLTASFKYDAIGRRIEKTISGVNIKYLYDGLDVIQEIQGTSKTNYIRTLNIDEPLTRIKADGTIRHYVRDALGSIIALTDDSGVVKTTYTYDPFGNVTVSGEASDNPFQYTGRENDGTGLYYYRARYYSPDLQRFISEDPIGFNGGSINFFSYVNNDPVNETDPYGLWTCIGCHEVPPPPILLPPGGPVIKLPPPPPPPGGKKTRGQCYAAAHWEYEMCMRGDSRDYDCNKQRKNDNCWTRMQDRLEACLQNAQ